MPRTPEPLDFGVCCACRERRAVGIAMMTVRAPVPGTGWGCLVCHLPQDGAVAALCDVCGDDENMVIRDVIYGYPSDRRRAAIELCTTPFKHVDRYHNEDFRAAQRRNAHAN